MNRNEKLFSKMQSLGVQGMERYKFQKSDVVMSAEMI
jgi:hypothetical protein